MIYAKKLLGLGERYTAAAGLKVREDKIARQIGI
jgi:hypothetical protein